MSKNSVPSVPSVTGEKTKKVENKYDAAELRRMIKEGRTCKEIMDALGINHKQQLKHHLMRLCTTDRAFYEIPGLYERNNRKAFVTNSGELKLRMKNIDFGDMVLKPDMEFDVTVQGNQIVLTNLSMVHQEPSSNPSGDGEFTHTEDNPSYE